MSNENAQPTEPAAKRPRTDSDQPTTDVLARSPEIWYEDGNVLLIAQEVEFRVHRSVLSRCSDVFKDMFEVGRPELSTYKSGSEDIPIVQLSDKANELTTFLKIVYSQGDEYVHSRLPKAR